jgi:hypothetical protein
LINPCDAFDVDPHRADCIGPRHGGDADVLAMADASRDSGWPLHRPAGSLQQSPGWQTKGGHRGPGRRAPGGKVATATVSGAADLRRLVRPKRPLQGMGPVDTKTRRIT